MSGGAEVGGSGGFLPGPARLDLPRPGDLAARIFPSLPVSAEWGTGRVRAALDDLGNPHLACPSLLVGGTNGKGSVAAIWASVLAERGSRVGLYTSPHLVSFRERVRVAGKPLPERRLIEAAREVRGPIVERGLTHFEAVTVLAFHVFADEAVDVAVAEVGLGGRLDATNVLEPILTAVTNVALDHQAFLGESLEEIAREKAGIAREGVPFVTAEGDPTIARVLEAEVRRHGGRFHRLDPATEILDAETDVHGSRFRLDTGSWGPMLLDSPLIGRHQIENLALAVRGLDLLPEFLTPPRDAVVGGVSAVRVPGRLQVERIRGRTWIFDVAHNPAAARALVEGIAALEPPAPRAFLVGILDDKDHGLMVSRLLETGDSFFVLTNPPNAPESRRWDPGEAAVRADSDRIVAVPSFENALREVERRAGSGGTVVVTGSHFTVGAALRAVGGSP